MSDFKEAPDIRDNEQFVLAGVKDQPFPVRAIGFGALALLVFVYFIHPAYPTVMGKSLAGWTWHGCNSVNGFLHGRFVPVAFGVMIWLAWKQVRNLQARPSYWGLLLLGLGFLLFLVSIRTIQPRLALIGAPFVVIGFTQYLFGFQITKHVVFPAFFLWFASPVPGLEAILTGNLQTFITKTCYHGGLMLGMDLTLSGSKIYIAGSTLDIAEGCSGIRSLMALTMIAAVYANYTQKPLWKKALLFASSFPLAVIGNFFRIFTILVLTHFGFGDFARKAYHDWAGLLIFFPIALSGLYLVDYLLNFREQRRKKVKRSVKKSRKVTTNTVTE